MAKQLRLEQVFRECAAVDRDEGSVRSSGLGALVAALPEGLSTPVGERGRTLSVGERQRVAVARALLVDPVVLVLDESTGSLDPATEALVVQGDGVLVPGRTTILITHRLELARQAERVVVLQGGRAVEDGSPEVLLRERGFFSELMRAAGREPPVRTDGRPHVFAGRPGIPP